MTATTLARHEAGACGAAAGHTATLTLIRP
jgi:hypothetical protein